MKIFSKLFIVLLLSISLLGCGNKETHRDKFLDVFEITTQEGTKYVFEYIEFDGYKIKTPTNLSLMSDEIKEIKYPNKNAPNTVYTNEDNSVNLALENNEINVDDEQIAEYTAQMKEVLNSLGEIQSVDIFERDNHTIGEIKVITQAIDTKIFNHMILFSVDGKLKIVSFNCTIEYYSELETVSDLIVNSIKFE